MNFLPFLLLLGVSVFPATGLSHLIIKKVLPSKISIRKLFLLHVIQLSFFIISIYWTFVLIFSLGEAGNLHFIIQNMLMYGFMWITHTTAATIINILILKYPQRQALLFGAVTSFSVILSLTLLIYMLFTFFASFDFPVNNF